MGTIYFAPLLLSIWPGDPLPILLEQFPVVSLYQLLPKVWSPYDGIVPPEVVHDYHGDIDFFVQPVCQLPGHPGVVAMDVRIPDDTS